MIKKGFIVIFGIFVFCLVYSSNPAQTQIFIKPTKTPEGISYLSGGVGKDERDSLSKMKMENGYNLKLVFALVKGPYLSNVEVQIKDSSGKKLIEAISEGPWFYAKLPPGKYDIAAKSMGKSFYQKADVPEKGRAVVNFFWKE